MKLLEHPALNRWPLLVRFSFAALALALAWTIGDWGLRRLDRVATAEQTRRDMRADPEGSQWWKDSQKWVQANEKIRAIWRCRIQRINWSSPLEGKPRIFSLSGEEPILLMGKAGPEDRKKALLLGLNEFAGFLPRSPKEGEIWCFAVERNLQGFSQVHEAFHLKESKGIPANSSSLQIP